MKRFAWRLQRVLDVKKKEEQKVRSELFELMQQLARFRSELLRQHKILEQIISGLTYDNPKKLLGEQEFFLKHSATIDKQIKMLKEKISQLETQQKEKISELLKVRRFKEGLERLRVEAKMQYLKEQSHLEQKKQDEAAAISFVRKVRS
jgi:flagellar FliJ protein